MRADIVAGAVFPDYELTDQTGKHRKLSDLQGPDPMIVVLSRGGYCPKDRRQAEGLLQLHHEMEVGYSRLVIISTDNMLTTNEYRTGVGAHWTFFSRSGTLFPTSPLATQTSGVPLAEIEKFLSVIGHATKCRDE